MTLFDHATAAFFALGAFFLLAFWAVFFAGVIAERWPRKIIRGRDPADAAPYVERYYLVRSRRFRLFLHHICRPDPGEDLHNHPWPLCGTIVLTGGYWERRRQRGLSGPAGKRYLGRGLQRFSFMRHAETYHRIDCVRRGTWTLFWTIGVRERRDWGFLVAGRFMPAKDYLPDYVLGEE